MWTFPRAVRRAPCPSFRHLSRNLLNLQGGRERSRASQSPATALSYAPSFICLNPQEDRIDFTRRAHSGACAGSADHSAL
jgi:hypothetical protein